MDDVKSKLQLCLLRDGKAEAETVEGDAVLIQPLGGIEVVVVEEVDRPGV